MTDESYSYDLNGNRTMTGYSTGTNNQLTSDGAYDYEYDDEGDRSAKEKISTGEREEYTWDHRNRLTKVTFKNGSGTVTKTVDQTYDIYNQWIRRTIDPDGPGSATAIDTFFSHESGQINLEFSGPASTNLSHRYFFNPAVVDQLLADETVTSLTSPGSVLWTLGDHLGTLRDLATYNATTDDAVIANHRLYDSFGKLTSETNTAIDELFGFTGRPLDDSTALQNNLNRWYDTAIGQWISEDPIDFGGRDFNLRRYATNSPDLWADPTGMNVQYVEYATRPKIRDGWYFEVFIVPRKDIPGQVFFQVNQLDLKGFDAEGELIAFLISMTWDVGFGVTISDEHEDAAFTFADKVTKYTGIEVCIVSSHTDKVFRYVDGVDYKLNGTVMHWTPVPGDPFEFTMHSELHIVKGNHAGESIEDHRGTQPNATDVTHTGRTHALALIEVKARYDMKARRAMIEVEGYSRDFDMRIQHAQYGAPF